MAHGIAEKQLWCCVGETFWKSALWKILEHPSSNRDSCSQGSVIPEALYYRTDHRVAWGSCQHEVLLATMHCSGQDLGKPRVLQELDSGDHVHCSGSRLCCGDWLLEKHSARA